VKNNGLKLYRTLFLLVIILLSTNIAFASENKKESEEFKPAEFILGHIADSYEWHITKINETDIAVPLPIIVYSKESGFHAFSFSQFHHAPTYEGFYIATEGNNKGKVVEKNSKGEEVRPFDFSITKAAFALLINSFLLIIIILYVAKWYKKKPLEAPKGFRGALEMLIMSLQNDIIKPSIGKTYKKYSPYLLTVFFFIFINNLMGLIPLFPGGANTTGNIAVTAVLALCTFIVVNIAGTKEYWKEIFSPEVPLWLKSPIFPLMPFLELIGIFTKPFALMVRLFANILAGHSVILAFTCLIFFVAKMNPAISISMTCVSVVFSVFMGFLELLVAFIQAYVFVILSAVFIGLAKVEAHHN
jgi:F-type H+-transporting ATPase subunit a